jgi:hypothetical protein
MSSTAVQFQLFRLYPTSDHSVSRIPSRSAELIAHGQLSPASCADNPRHHLGKSFSKVSQIAKRGIVKRDKDHVSEIHTSLHPKPHSRRSNNIKPRASIYVKPPTASHSALQDPTHPHPQKYPSSSQTPPAFRAYNPSSLSPACVLALIKISTLAMARV